MEAWERPWCAPDAQLRELDAHSPEGLSEAVICPRGVGKTQMPVVRWVPPPYPAAPPPLALSPPAGEDLLGDRLSMGQALASARDHLKCRALPTPSWELVVPPEVLGMEEGGQHSGEGRGVSRKAT